MLVGNKVDLVEKNPKKREVSLEESRAFAEENRLLMCETSALTSYKVTQAFEDLLQGSHLV
jgi:Rab family protein